MALKATIFKADVQISDLDRGYYARHQLTLARHPSETDERMMLRLAAFICHADEKLAFTRGLCADDEPALWQQNDAGEYTLWIELGEPDDNRLKKACSRAESVWLYSYGGRATDIWWQNNQGKLSRLDNLTVASISPDTLAGLAGLTQRSMQLNATLQDGQLWLSDGNQTVLLEPDYLQRGR